MPAVPPIAGFLSKRFRILRSSSTGSGLNNLAELAEIEGSRMKSSLFGCTALLSGLIIVAYGLVDPLGLGADSADGGNPPLLKVSRIPYPLELLFPERLSELCVVHWDISLGLR